MEKRTFIYNNLLDRFTELKNPSDIDYLEVNFNYRWLNITDDLCILSDGHIIVGFTTSSNLALEDLTNESR